jgi:hypothetical protein
MIDERRIDAALRPQPDVEATPFFARRVMHAIRQPEALRFPWGRLTAAGGAAVAAMGLSMLFAADDVDAVACAALAVAALVAAAVERVVAAHR